FPAAMLGKLLGMRRQRHLRGDPNPLFGHLAIPLEGWMEVRDAGVGTAAPAQPHGTGKRADHFAQSHVIWRVPLEPACAAPSPRAPPPFARRSPARPLTVRSRAVW